MVLWLACGTFIPRDGGGGVTQVTGRCKWGHKLQAKKSHGLETKPPKKPLGQNETPKKSHTEFWNLTCTSTQKV